MWENSVEIENPMRIWSFWTKVIVDSPGRCWPWIGARDSDGYGNFTTAKGVTRKAHIFSWVLHFGEIPAGMQVDHECNHPYCVNPNCLQLLTGPENNERSNSASAVNKRKTHCKYGHVFDDANTLRKNGRRICIMCEKDRGRM
jgi:HNH endonuclease